MADILVVGITLLNVAPLSHIIISENVEAPFIILTPAPEPILSVPPVVKLLNKLIVSFQLLGDKYLLVMFLLDLKLGLKYNNLMC